jgi:hypothetical protein
LKLVGEYRSNGMGTTPHLDDWKRAESLLTAERQTLEMIAAGASLADVIASLCNAIDAQSQDVMSSVLLMDPDGKRLWPAAGQRVPKEWNAAITPLPIGPRMGSCGTAAFRKERVINSDIASDPLWSGSPAAEYRDYSRRAPSSNFNLSTRAIIWSNSGCNGFVFHIANSATFSARSA